MMYSKFFLLLLGCFWLGLNPLLAEKKSNAEKARVKVEEMQKNLQLTSEQAGKITDIYIKSYMAIDDYEAKKPGKSLKKKQKEIVKKMREDQIRKVLTAAQYKKYKALKEKEKADEKAEKKKLESMKLDK